MSFESLGLREEVLKAIVPLGFENPTAIQEKAIPSLIESNRDLVGLAQTGTGKTAAFGLPIVHLINFSKPVTQAVVLCPTRELCLQISGDLKEYSSQFVGARITPVYGGSSIEKQIRDLRKGSQIVVATPGRLIDLINRGKVDFNQVEIAVLDEADEMLNMGFKEDIDFILSHTPHSKRTWLFSATMPKEVAAIAKNFMTDPLEITVGSKNSSATTISHKYITVHGRNRYPALKRILDFNPDIYGIVFCNTRNHTREVAEKLARDGYNAEPLHGDLSQAERDSVMSKFRSKTTKVLVATDVAARGIDVDEITHVIHYMLPDDVENYTHRSGRTGRAGKKGMSIAIVDPRDMGKVRDIERIMKQSLAHEKLPEPKDICGRQLGAYINRVVNTEVNQQEMETYLENISEELADFDREEIIALFVSNHFNNLFDYYKNAPDLNVDASRSRMSGGRESRSNGNFQRIFVNVGTMDGIDKGAILRLVCSRSAVTAQAVGRIDLKNQFSFVEVENKFASEVVDSLRGAEIDGREVRAEFSSQEPRGGGSRSGGGRRRDGGGYKSKDRGSSRRRDGGSGGGNRKPYESYHKRTQHK
ncbi:DEAD/DEAH box helicase [Luteibaculum oceani]|uniref:DEAD/DEAH box helicase n=1 Tax=Luteibaculum oceani TaxID=1294296 RepID=A0A5C6V7W4_9FLAO|nr:DEAD/DEAH box helicase [Luteibaculum oceani]TXC81362.1 DEAD/DEAH box helicase [Luteibaculum oceani]